MIHEIIPRLDNSFHNFSPADSDEVFCFEPGKLLVCDDTARPFPEYGALGGNTDVQYLFSIGERRFFLAKGEITVPEGYSFREIRSIRHAEGALQENVFAMFTGLHLWKWYSSNRFCGRCGGGMFPDEKERALRCACGNIVYPRIDPAVIVGVISGERILLTRYAAGRGVGYNALVAGYTEIGETLEETVRREVMEEVGLEVTNIRYFASQPWGFSGGILAGFYCDAADTDIALDTSELSSAVWTAREDIQLQPDGLSLTNEMMKRFKEGKIC